MTSRETFAPTHTAPGLTIDYRGDLSYEEFAAEYLYASRPVILTSALRASKAVGRWTPEFLRREFGDMTFAPDENRPQERCTMARFIDRVLASTEENPAPYLRNRVVSEMFPSLARDIEPLPEYLFPNWLPERYLAGHVGKVLNRGAALEIYIGGKGGAFPVLHYDGAGTHAFLMQIYGRKKFVLFPPDQERYLYPSPEKENLSLIDSVERPDLTRFPLFAQAAPLEFVLEPGQTAFIPSHWWHTTRMLTPSISISANVVNESNWHELIAYVCARRRPALLSGAARVYLTGAGAWRAWRDRASRPVCPRPVRPRPVRPRKDETALP